MIDFSTLNQNQRDAVQWGYGPLLVLAGPGSGKTRVLTFRIARMVEETPNRHFKILGLTFTNKAAAEMRDRIAQLVPDVGKRTLLTTFHSFSADLLRQHGHHVGIKPDFDILAQKDDRLSLLDEAIEQSNIGQSGKSSENLLSLITDLIEKDISPDEALFDLQKKSYDEPEALTVIYKRYRELMIESNSLDFAGLIAEALNLLRNNKGICRHIQKVYPYICVDEFQDTNLSQYKILHHLVNPEKKNLFVVADDDQIIYQWNGANSKRLWEIQNDFEMKLLQLPENYRCMPEVVALANKLISHNSDRFTGKDALKAHKEKSNSQVVRIEHFSKFAEEAKWVAKNIATRPIETRVKCAVLARTNNLLKQVIEALSEQGIKGYSVSRKDEFESIPLRWLHSILRLANTRNNREHLRRICRFFFRLEGMDLDVKDIISHADAENGGDYLRSWTSAALNREELSSSARELLTKILLPALADRLDFRKFQKHAFQWLDTLPDISPDRDGIFDEYRKKKATWYRLLDEISMKHGKNEVTLHLLLQELDLHSKSPEPSKHAIPCFTIHTSKGMEFDHVYLVGMVEDQLPVWSAIKKGDNSLEMQEERRNCFVAITRAQETLTLTYADELQGWSKSPSRFLSEMGCLR